MYSALRLVLLALQLVDVAAPVGRERFELLRESRGQLLERFVVGLGFEQRAPARRRRATAW